MRLKPIFDTNIFGNIQDGLISKSDLRFLMRHRPGHGWPLSMVTAMELLSGVHDVPPEKFFKVKGQVALALNLSNRRILEEPRFLLCREVLRIPFPTALVAPSAKTLSDHLEVVRCAKSREDIEAGCVPVKGLQTRGKGCAGFAGFRSSVLNDLVAGPKREWLERSEGLASEIYPEWRQHFEEKRKRLPDEMRKRVESRREWESERVKYIEGVLTWLGADPKAKSVADTSRRLDAVLEFTIFVVREFLLRNYNLEKHESDIYDIFQLHYLAVDRFVIVTGDLDLSKRTLNSCQADRIVTFEKFMRGL
jgi:hypothetical protein